MSMRDLFCRWFGIGCPKPPPIDPPPVDPPPGSRPNLEFCYYGVQLTDPPQIANHVTMAHVGSWYDWDNFPGMLDMVVQYCDACVDAGINRLMITLDFCLFAPREGRKHSLPRDTQVNNLITLADRLRNDGLLNKIVAFYVIDEPNISENQLSDEDVTNACYAIRDVFGHYVTTMPKLAIIYGQSNSPYPGIAQLDWAGFDNYGAPIFSNGQYAQLRAQMSPSQMTIIAPGGGSPWREDPNPFYNFAQTHPEVAAIMPFKWFDPDGIVSNGMAPAYTRVGNAVVAGNEA